MKYEKPEMEVIRMGSICIVVTSSVNKKPSSGEDDDGYEWEW